MRRRLRKHKQICCGRLRKFEGGACLVYLRRTRNRTEPPSATFLTNCGRCVHDPKVMYEWAVILLRTRRAQCFCRKSRSRISLLARFEIQCCHVCVWRTKNKSEAHEERHDSDEYREDEKSYRQIEQQLGHPPRRISPDKSLPSGDARSLQSFSTIP